MLKADRVSMALEKDWSNSYGESSSLGESALKLELHSNFTTVLASNNPLDEIIESN